MLGMRWRSLISMRSNTGWYGEDSGFSPSYETISRYASNWFVLFCHLVETTKSVEGTDTFKTRKKLLDEESKKSPKRKPRNVPIVSARVTPRSNVGAPGGDKEGQAHGSRGSFFATQHFPFEKLFGFFVFFHFLFFSFECWEIPCQSQTRCFIKGGR